MATVRFYAVATLPILAVLYQMFYARRVSLPALVDLLSDGDATPSRQASVYRGWRAVLAGLFWLAAACLPAFILLTSSRH